MKNLILCSVLYIFVSSLMLPSDVFADILCFSDDFSGTTLNPFWTLYNTGIPTGKATVEGGVLAISDQVAPNKYVDIGVRSNSTRPLESFTTSVDFRVIEGSAMPWLMVWQYPSQHPHNNWFGVYLYNRHEYFIWYRNAGTDFKTIHCRNAFGDETTHWHNFKLVYDATTKEISAYLDNTFLQSSMVDLSNAVVGLSMKDNTDFGAGPNKIQFDNFTYQTVPEPSSIGECSCNNTSCINEQSQSTCYRLQRRHAHYCRGRR